MNLSRSRPVKQVRYDTPIALIKEDTVPDAIGNQVPIEIERIVYAQEIGAGLNAIAVPSLRGMRGVVQFEIWKHDYQDEEKLRVGTPDGGKVYRIAHTQSYDQRAIRLLCERVR